MCVQPGYRSREYEELYVISLVIFDFLVLSLINYTCWVHHESSQELVCGTLIVC